MFIILSSRIFVSKMNGFTIYIYTHTCTYQMRQFCFPRTITKTAIIEMPCNAKKNKEENAMHSKLFKNKNWSCVSLTTFLLIFNWIQGTTITNTPIPIFRKTLRQFFLIYPLNFVRGDICITYKIKINLYKPMHKTLQPMFKLYFLTLFSLFSTCLNCTSSVICFVIKNLQSISLMLRLINLVKEVRSLDPIYLFYYVSMIYQ